MPRMQTSQIEVHGTLLPSHVPRVYLTVDKPKDAECDSLPDTLNVRVMIASVGGGARDAYYMLEAGDNIVRDDGGTFNICDNKQDTLTQVEIHIEQNLQNIIDSTEDLEPFDPNSLFGGDEDFGEPF